MDACRSATLHEEKSSRPTNNGGDTSVVPIRASVTEEKNAEAGVAFSPRPSLNDRPEHEQQIDANELGGLGLNKIKTSETGVEYPHGVKLALITLALCLSVFLMALDNTIIATAIPKITDEFNSLPDVGWYGSAYLLTTAAFQLLFGKFYSFFSIKYVYLTAIAIFELGSLICGVAPSSSALIVGRAVAGLGSAGIFSGALIIIAYSVPLRQRPIYTGFIGAMYGIASVAGPLLGGVFTEKVSWRWCFYVNLPLGAITLGVIVLFFKVPEREEVASLTWKGRIAQLDLLGTLFFTPAVVCLLLALQWGGFKYPWSDGRIITLCVVFGILIVAFVGIQVQKKDNATVPPRIVKNRSVAASAFFIFCLGSAFFIMIYYLPVWLQGVQGVSAVESGIRNLPLVLGLIITSIISGIGVSSFGYYAPWMIAGTIVMSTGFGLITTFKPDSGSPTWIGLQALAGIGLGMGMQQPLMAVQTVLDISDVPTATAVLIFMQTLGGALFVSVAQNVFSNKLISGVAQYAPGLDPKVVLTLGATNIQAYLAEKAPQYLSGVILAYNEALVKAFTVATAMAALSIIGSTTVEWKSVKTRRASR